MDCVVWREMNDDDDDDGDDDDPSLLATKARKAGTRETYWFHIPA